MRFVADVNAGGPVMTYLGIAKGKTIEFPESLPFAEGQTVRVSIEPAVRSDSSSVAAKLRRAMHRPPLLDPLDVDELERIIDSGKLPVGQKPAFSLSDEA